MSFKINLKPFPAAEYFTVRDHGRVRYKNLSESGFLKEGVVKNLSTLFNIPEGYSFHILGSTEWKAMKKDLNLTLKDDPSTGIDIYKKGFLKPDASILDLSYSFPQLPPDYSEIHQVFIDPAMSLGIPVDLVFLISDNDLLTSPAINEAISQEESSLYLLDAVVKDYLARGIDVLLRESNYKAAVLNQLMEDCSFFLPLAEKRIRSNTILLAETDQDTIQTIEKSGYEVGTFQENGKTVLAIANYPTHSKELIEMFADRIMAF
jgi:hypothetical protein